MDDTNRVGCRGSPLLPIVEQRGWLVVVDRGAADQEVVIGAADQGVAAAAAEEQVAAAAALQDVLARAAQEDVGAGAAQERVVAGAPVHQGADAHVAGDLDVVVAFQGVDDAAQEERPRVEGVDLAVEVNPDRRAAAADEDPVVAVSAQNYQRGGQDRSGPDHEADARLAELEGTDIGFEPDDAVEVTAALIGVRTQGIEAGVEGRAVGEGRARQGRAAVVLQGTQPRVDRIGLRADLVAVGIAVADTGEGGGANAYEAPDAMIDVAGDIRGVVRLPDSILSDNCAGQTEGTDA